MERFADIITEFGGPTKFAAAMGIPPSHAGVMKTRGSIPAEYWERVIDSARDLGIAGITYETLMKMMRTSVAERRLRKKPAPSRRAKPARSRRSTASAPHNG